MTQLVGGVVIFIAVLILVYWVWNTFGKNTTVGKTISNSTAGKILDAAFDTGKLTVNLGYVEMLKQVDEVVESPDAVKACDLLAETLWKGAMNSWKEAVAASATASAKIETVKVTTVDGSVVEVPVQ